MKENEEISIYLNPYMQKFEPQYIVSCSTNKMITEIAGNAEISYSGNVLYIYFIQMNYSKRVFSKRKIDSRFLTYLFPVFNNVHNIFFIQNNLFPFHYRKNNKLFHLTLI